LAVARNKDRAFGDLSYVRALEAFLIGAVVGPRADQISHRTSRF
jgi:hypothetical protein